MKHHFVPIFYLKPWTDPDGNLVEYIRPYNELRDKRKHPAGTAWKPDLYAIEGVSDSAKHWLETKFLARVDCRAAIIRDKMRADQRIDNARDRSDWARFLLSLIHRNPDKIGWLKEEWEKQRVEIMTNLEKNYATERRPHDPLTFEEMMENSDPAEFEKGFARLAQKVMDSQTVGLHLINMRWQVFRFHAGHSLLTSDRPLVWTNGMTHPSGHMALAISPSEMFVAANNDDAIRHLFGMGKRLAAAYNDFVVSQAAETVYGHDLCQKRFVDNRLNRCPQQISLGRRVPVKFLQPQRLGFS